MIYNLQIPLTDDQISTITSNLREVHAIVDSGNISIVIEKTDGDLTFNILRGDVVVMTTKEILEAEFEKALTELKREQSTKSKIVDAITVLVFVAALAMMVTAYFVR